MKHLSLETLAYREVLGAFEAFLVQRGYQPSTIAQLPAHVREFLFRLETKEGIRSLKLIEPAHVQSHYQYLTTRPNTRRQGGLSDSMLKHHIYALRTFFSWLVRIEAIDLHPMSSLSFPRPGSSPRVAIAREDVRALYKEAGTPLERAVLGIYYGCGLRRSEGEALNRGDINFASRRLIVREGKFGKRREVPIHASVADDLRSYWRDQRPLLVAGKEAKDKDLAFLVNRSGRRMRGATANKIAKQLANRAGIRKEVTLHVLRHSIATHLKENGMRMEEIAEFLGHSTLDVTQNYLSGYRPVRWSGERRNNRPWKRR